MGLERDPHLIWMKINKDNVASETIATATTDNAAKSNDASDDQPCNNNRSSKLNCQMMG